MFMPVSLFLVIFMFYLRTILWKSMPKMPEAEKKEETAESREEAKEQVNSLTFLPNEIMLQWKGALESCRSKKDWEGKDWEIQQAERRS